MEKGKRVVPIFDRHLKRVSEDKFLSHFGSEVLLLLLLFPERLFRGSMSAFRAKGKMEGHSLKKGGKRTELGKGFS